MQTSDRPEFERQLAMLCAAYSVPVGDRSGAYWQSFIRLGLVEFARLVEHCIGPDGPDRLPTCKCLWGLRANLRTGNRSSTHTMTAPLIERVIEAALRTWRLSDSQVRMPWSWIAAPDGGCVGVIIPQDETKPTEFPARRLLVSELQPVSHPA